MFCVRRHSAYNLLSFDAQALYFVRPLYIRIQVVHKICSQNNGSGTYKVESQITEEIGQIFPNNPVISYYCQNHWIKNKASSRTTKPGPQESKDRGEKKQVWEWQNHGISFQEKPENREMCSSSKECWSASVVRGGEQIRRKTTPRSTEHSIEDFNNQCFESGSGSTCFGPPGSVSIWSLILAI